MEITENNEILPEKELNTSFRVPRKRAADLFDEDKTITMDRSPVLSNIYHNEYYPEAQTEHLPSQHKLKPYRGPAVPLLPNQITAQTSSITESIFKALEYQKERPKTYEPGNIIRQIIPDTEDSSLPKELTAMFQPLYCKLCSLQLSSNVTAKMHYKSRNHEKNIKKFLISHSEKTGEPLHKRAKVSTKTKTEGEDNPRYFHCETCDLPLTGKLHAESHYMGRNHQKALLGKKAPAGKGYYDANGKWVRLQSLPKAALNGDDTFGLDFRKKDATVQEASEIVEKPSLAPLGTFKCDLCNIACTCKKQIEAHYTGQKHLKKLKQRGIVIENFSIPVEEPGIEGHDSAANNTKATRNDFSRFKTPSGLFYCELCNTTLNSELQLKQHLQSKNHSKKTAKKI